MKQTKLYRLNKAKSSRLNQTKLILLNQARGCLPHRVRLPLLNKLRLSQLNRAKLLVLTTPFLLGHFALANPIVSKSDIEKFTIGFFYLKLEEASQANETQNFWLRQRKIDADLVEGKTSVPAKPATRLPEESQDEFHDRVYYGYQRVPIFGDRVLARDYRVLKTALADKESASTAWERHLVPFYNKAAKRHPDVIQRLRRVVETRYRPCWMKAQTLLNRENTVGNRMEAERALDACKQILADNQNPDMAYVVARMSGFPLGQKKGLGGNEGLKGVGSKGGN